MAYTNTLGAKDRSNSSVGSMMNGGRNKMCDVLLHKGEKANREERGVKKRKRREENKK